MTSTTMPRLDSARLAELHDLLRGSFPAGNLVVDHWDSQPWTGLFCDAEDALFGLGEFVLAPYRPVPAVIIDRDELIEAEFRVVPTFVVEYIDFTFLEDSSFTVRVSENMPVWESYPTDEQIVDVLASAWLCEASDELRERPDPRVRDALATLISCGGHAAVAQFARYDLPRPSHVDDRRWDEVVTQLTATATAYRAACD